MRRRCRRRDFLVNVRPAGAGHAGERRRRDPGIVVFLGPDRRAAGDTDGNQEKYDSLHYFLLVVVVVTVPLVALVLETAGGPVPVSVAVMPLVEVVAGTGCTVSVDPVVLSAGFRLQQIIIRASTIASRRIESPKKGSELRLAVFSTLGRVFNAFGSVSADDLSICGAEVLRAVEKTANRSSDPIRKRVSNCRARAEDC